MRCYWLKDIDKVVLALCCQFCGCFSRTCHTLFSRWCFWCFGCFLRWTELLSWGEETVGFRLPDNILICFVLIAMMRKESLILYERFHCIFSYCAILETLLISVLSLVAGHIPSPLVILWRVTVYAFKTTPSRNIVPYVFIEITEGYLDNFRRGRIELQIKW